MTKPITPTCPNCGYDLTGLLEPHASVQCPECSERTTFQFATITISRWPTIRRAFIWLIAAPLIATFISWRLLYTDGWYDGFAGELGLMLVVMQEFYLPIALITFLVKEWRIRHRLQRHFRPSGWISAFIILIYGATSITLGMRVLYMWMSSIASI